MSARRQKAEGGSEVTLPITPMLDMTFQLLFFFIISYYMFQKDHPKMVIEGQMDLSLPTEAAEAKAKDQDDSDIHAPSHTDATAEDLFKDAITLTVEAEDRGDAIKVIHLKQAKLPEVDPPPANLAALSDKLKDIAQSPDALKQSLWIQCDAKLQWSVAVQVMDVCRKIGYQKIGFLSPNYPKKNPG
jgi:biopolymer transport protein ExbD